MSCLSTSNSRFDWLDLALKLLILAEDLFTLELLEELLPLKVLRNLLIVLVIHYAATLGRN